MNATSIAVLTLLILGVAAGVAYYFLYVKQVTYTTLQNTDYVGHDIKNVSLSQAKLACDSDPNCKGYNSSGWLKAEIDQSSKQSQQGVTFYVKD